MNRPNLQITKNSQNFRIKSIKNSPQKTSDLRLLSMSLTCRSLIKKSQSKPPQQEIKQSVVQNQPGRLLQKQTSIKIRQSIISVTESNASCDDEDFEVWDNDKDLRIKKIILEEQKPSVGQFLQLYKARYGAFPGQKQQIKNEEVIKAAINCASQSKKLFKKYFPSKQIVFEDQNDYSEPYNIEQDQNFQKFNKFFTKQKLQTTSIKLPQKFNQPSPL